MPLSSCSLSVEEFHGPYGPFNVSELVLQRVWQERAYDAAKLRDEQGRLIEVEFPGKWNRLDGPDFKGAALRIDGQRVEGDVEIHFAQSDWKSHGHERDANYDRVVLHVVYHRPRPDEAPAFRRDGEPIPCVALLPILWYSLEEYASEDSIIASTGVDLRPEVERLLQLGLGERRERLVEQARQRWEQKLHFARQRVDRLGWSGACHQTALEAMGYAKNRLPMLVVAQRYPLADWSSGDVEVEQAWRAGRGRWSLSGSRPANHPRLRLEQYRAWAQARPHWPSELQVSLARWQAPALSSSDVAYGSIAARRQLRIPQLREWTQRHLFDHAVSGAKADTLVCDGFLPLLATTSDAALFDLWFHWPAGNGPASCAAALKQLQILEPRRIPLCNGWLQGMLGARMAGS